MGPSWWRAYLDPGPNERNPLEFVLTSYTGGGLGIKANPPPALDLYRGVLSVILFWEGGLV